jgi:hypothetical protein
MLHVQKSHGILITLAITCDELNNKQTNKLTPCSRGLPEKLTGLQLDKKFRAFYGTRRFITAFTTDRHLSLSCDRSIQSMPLHPTSKDPFMPGSFRWPPSLRFLHPSSPPYVLNALLISAFLI